MEEDRLIIGPHLAVTLPEEIILLENFTSTATTPITELRLDYFPYGAIHPYVVSLFSHCPKLEFVSFSPKPFRIPTIKSSHPRGVSFPNVVAFGISMSSEYSELDKFMNSLSLIDFLEIVSIFPNLKILRCGTLPRNIAEYFLSDKASIREISVRLRNKDPPFSITERSLFLTRVEFQLGFLSNSRNYNVIIATFADQLEKLKLTAEYNFPREVLHSHDTQITLPQVLPRLKYFEIGISRGSSYRPAGQKMLKVPALHLNFDGYSTQLPALEKLVISERETRYRSQDETEEQDRFEMCAGFLSKHFLRGECLTLRDLKIPLPPRKRVGFKLFQKLGNVGTRIISKLIDCSDFFERIVTTFPNLRWETFEGVDSPWVEEWVGVGCEKGLLERATPLITELHLDYFPHELFIHPHVATLFSHCPKLEFVSFSPKTFRIPTMKSSLSSGLVKLKLTADSNLPRRLLDLNEGKVLVTINFPKVLPRLKCLAIGIPRGLSFGQKLGTVPGLHLNLGGYSIQLPALEKLVIAERDEWETKYWSQDETEEEQEWFEIWAEFLAKYFLRGECLTLRDLKVPLPPGERVGFKLFQKLGGGRNKVISELVDCSDFFERIVTTFPNLRWEMFQGVDPERVEEWVRIGCEMGLLEKKGLNLG
ncbi:hypothetical protein Fcan01_15708 [Folsomia candida]|uniref:Uncharacterized protein n=1 Tax=Folsomia candida TaxID=158441 RepID=A0A226DWX1_FOLCA|nr:hypothetical protein Fcan01_15708 [Folsomia candida]